MHCQQRYCFAVESDHDDRSAVDAVSMAFLRSFADAASQLARDGVTPLATVDCFDWTDVCGANNVTAYPTVRVYRKGREWTAYSGMLDTGSVVSTAKLYVRQFSSRATSCTPLSTCIPTQGRNMILACTVAVLFSFLEQCVAPVKGLRIQGCNKEHACWCNKPLPICFRESKLDTSHVCVLFVFLNSLCV